MATVTARVTQPGSPAAKLLYQGASNQQVSLVITVVTSSATVYVGGPNVKSTNGAPVVQASGPLTLTGFIGALYFIGAAGSEVVSWAATPISGAAVVNVAGIVTDVAANTLAIETETTRAEAAEATNATAITTETTRAEAAEALLAPKTSPTFTGTVTGSGWNIDGSGNATFAESILAYGAITAGAAIQTAGAGGGFVFYDRDGVASDQFLWSANAGTVSLYATAGSTNILLTVDESGNATFAGSVTVNSKLTLHDGLGFWQHAAPASQPVRAVTLSDVIAVLAGCGLTA